MVVSLLVDHPQVQQVAQRFNQPPVRVRGEATCDTKVRLDDCRAPRQHNQPRQKNSCSSGFEVACLITEELAVQFPLQTSPSLSPWARHSQWGSKV